MEGLDVLTTTQQGGAFGGNALLSDAFPLGMTYESQELKMDLFLDEIPEEEFISAFLAKISLLNIVQCKQKNWYLSNMIVGSVPLRPLHFYLIPTYLGSGSLLCNAFLT
ncbi:hypothetical protein LOD99_15919 [Oopsacas minuta]|uniref:Uncharacterized protein n=1 Tax=Oopsacas minuta TaxID=111878 RepID=A0AAV7K7C7_9METZ|nr:hypothetical protein LOD99_15919 [Oopsacas minuta]